MAGRLAHPRLSVQPPRAGVISACLRGLRGQVGTGRGGGLAGRGSTPFALLKARSALALTMALGTSRNLPGPRSLIWAVGGLGSWRESPPLTP